MELRVQLKICEVCGCLWYRSQLELKVYCDHCFDRLKEFPPPARNRRLRGRPKKVSLTTVWAVASVAGGIQ